MSDFADAVNENLRRSIEQQNALIKGQISAQQLHDEKAAKSPSVAAYQEMASDRQQQADNAFPYVTHAQLLEVLDAVSADRKHDAEQNASLQERITALEEHVKALCAIHGAPSEENEKPAPEDMQEK